MARQPGCRRADAHSLARVPAAHDLARLVPRLAPETLHRIIERVGLDASEDLVVSATPAQLAAVFDLDLWRSAEAGQDEGFDAGRFGEWLEVLVQAGDDVAARIVAGLDRKLVVAGLSRHVLVFDRAVVRSLASADDERIDVGVASDEGLTSEVGGYVVHARRTDSWDAIIELLLALADAHSDCFHAVMRECRRLSDSGAETDGLDNLLSAPRQVLHDLAVDREDRRAKRGYITPADARAFLDLARRGSRTARAVPGRMNAIAAGYLQAAAEPLERSPQTQDATAADRIVDLFAAAAVVRERPRALLAGAGQHDPLARIRPLMDYLLDHDEGAYLARTREVAFLANALMAGCSVQSRSFTAPEASDAAVAICNLGLEHWATSSLSGVRRPASGVADLPCAFLVDHDLVTAFEAGWEVLYQEVSLCAARELVEVLARARCVDAEIQVGLDRLQRDLTKQCQAGAPWRARDALDAIAVLDVPAWAALLGLFGECPVVSAALSAIVERRTGAISATEFRFISTRRQIETIRTFMSRLPAILEA